MELYQDFSRNLPIKKPCIKYLIIPTEIIQLFLTLQKIFPFAGNLFVITSAKLKVQAVKNSLTL